jgi:hypothetical protein
MSNEINPAPKLYSVVQIKVIQIYGDAFDYEVFLRLSPDKVIKIAPQNESKLDTLGKFEKRGVKEVLLLEKDFNLFLINVKEKMAKTKTNKNITTEESAEGLDHGLRVLGVLFEKGYIDTNTKEILDNVTATSLNLSKKTTLINSLRAFKIKCGKEYMRGLISAHISVLMIDTFTWKIDTIKEKVTKAALLCDILLSPEDFEKIEKCKGDWMDLPDKIYNHPEDMGNLLSKNKEFNDSEIITIIRSHHETPNGTGYPNKLKYAGMNVLASIYLVAYNFTELIINDLLLEPEDLPALDKSIVSAIEQLKPLYNQGNYKKAFEALEKAMSKSVVDKEAA